MGKAFTDMRDFANEVAAVHYRLEDNGRAHAFLKNWKDALTHVTIIEEEVWKTLQQSRTAAQTEITKITLSWRDEALAEVAAAEEMVQKLYAEAGLSGKYEENGVRQALTNLRSDIDNATKVVDASQIGAVIRGRIETIIKNVQEQFNKIQPGVSDKKPPEPMKILGQRKSQIIANDKEWETFKDDLDSRVQKILKEGKRVELR
jgi:hypothetical protein